MDCDSKLGGDMDVVCYPSKDDVGLHMYFTSLKKIPLAVGHIRGAIRAVAEWCWDGFFRCVCEEGCPERG